MERCPGRIYWILEGAVSVAAESVAFIPDIVSAGTLVTIVNPISESPNRSRHSEGSHNAIDAYKAHDCWRSIGIPAKGTGIIDTRHKCIGRARDGDIGERITR